MRKKKMYYTVIVVFLFLFVFVHNVLKYIQCIIHLCIQSTFLKNSDGQQFQTNISIFWGKFIIFPTTCRIYRP